MSADEQKPIEPEGAEETEQSEGVTVKGAPSLVGHDASPMRSLLSKPSDVAARPGFRAPSNAKTKAQKAAKKKGKKRR
jgi:hypothetical protein